MSILLTNRYRNHFLLNLPAFMTLGSTSLFLIHEEFYASMSHLWISSQIIGIIFAIYLGLPKWNMTLLGLNITVPPIIASQFGHLDPIYIMSQQAIVYFASIMSIFLSYQFLDKKLELIKARDLALEAENTKTEFLANMSHELRTPMNGVVGILQLLKKEGLAPKQKGLIDIGLSSSKSLLTIISDILDFTKMESRQLTLEQRPTDVIELCEETIQECSPLLKNKSLTINFKSHPDLHPIWFTDSIRFKQILFNLISNAVKFTEKGFINIVLYEKDDILKIRVQDTGMGMDQTAIENLFIRFSQASTSTSRKFGGTGLGMAITQQLVNLMGGDIQVESEVSKGTTFNITLKLHKALQSKAEKEDELTDFVPDLLGTTILLAEDNLINQEVFKAALEPTCTQLLIANDGVEAVELFKQNHIDFVFLDIRMPNMGGVEAGEIIKALDPKVPMIAVTANVFKDDIENYKTIGFDEHLPKPINMKELMNIFYRYNYTKAIPKQKSLE